MHAIGLLLPPSNIQLEYQWYNLQVIISWQQPFTLNITHQGSKHVISYKIYICTEVESSVDCEVYNTTNTQYTHVHNFSAITQPDLVCNNLVSSTFQVSSINMVGESARSEPVYLHNVFCTSTPGICL